MSHQPVLCVGEALWDNLPRGKLPGGAPMNVALRLTALGTPARLLTRIGDDADGRDLQRFMTSQGLDTRYVQTDPMWPTGTVDVDTSFADAPCYDIVAPVAWDYIDADEYLEAGDGLVDVLVCGSLGARNPVSRDSQLRLMAAARLCVFDVNLRAPYDDRTILDNLIWRADWIKLNALELRRIVHERGAPQDVADAARWLRERYSLALVCVTLGPDGALLLWNDIVYRQAAFPVDVVDTIGCGDAFLGTLLSDLLHGRDPKSALERACAAGAIVARYAGGNPQFRDEDIQRMLQGRWNE